MHYVIKYNDEKILIQAQSSLDAIAHWIKSGPPTVDEDGEEVGFNPGNFSIEEVGEYLYHASKIKII